MCTLSWQIRDNRLTVLFNRDISVFQDRGAPPEITSLGDARVMAPVGSNSGGGAPIMVNEYGLVFCLMRDFRVASKKRTGSDSAESLLAKLAGVTNLHELRTRLADIDPNNPISADSGLARFDPFLLTVFPGVFPPLQWHWDGVDWKEVTAVPPVITTSSYFPTWTQKRRIRVFRKGTGDYRFTLDDERHLALHRRCASSFPAAFIRRAAFALPVASASPHRINGREISVCRIRVEEAVIRMSWHFGGPESRHGPASRHGSESRPEPESRHGPESRPEPESRPGPVRDVQMSRKPEPAMQRRIFTPEPYSGKLIDIEGIFRERSPELYQKVPGWVFRLIRIIINEKRLNRYLGDVSNRPGNYLASNALHHLEVRAEVRPPAGHISSSDVRPVTKPGRRVMFMANHPTGGLDGLLLLHWLSGYYPDIRIIANDLLYIVPHLRPWLIPVDIYRPGRESMARLREVFDDDAPLLIYPAGSAARRIKGELVEAQWKKMSVKLAREHKRNIVLIHIDGYNSNLFNSVAWLRRTAGIRMNLEMLLLSRALTNPACKCYGITIGPTVSPEEIEALGKTDRDRAAKLQQMCTLLPKKLNREIGIMEDSILNH